MVTSTASNVPKVVVKEQYAEQYDATVPHIVLDDPSSCRKIVRWALQTGFSYSQTGLATQSQKELNKLLLQSASL